MIVPLFLALVFSPSGANHLNNNSTYIRIGDKFTVTVQMDDLQVSHYDNNTVGLLPDTEWMKKISTHETEQWNKEKNKIQTEQKDLRSFIDTIMDHFKNPAGDHTLTQIHGCQCENQDGGCSGFKKYIYDNEEFIRLDLKNATWIPATNDAKDFLMKTKWDSTKTEAEAWKKRVETDCRQSLKLYMKYSLTRGEVQVFQQKISSSSDLVCHATGFFPSAVNMTWQKDGEKVEEDVEIRETLPNRDGSFQKRIILRISPEDLKKHKYTCVIQHSSLKEDLKVEFKVEPHEESGSTGIIIGIVMALLIVIAAVGFFIWKKKSDSEHVPDSEKGSCSSDKHLMSNAQSRDDVCL